MLPLRVMLPQKAAQRPEPQKQEPLLMQVLTLVLQRVKLVQ